MGCGVRKGKKRFEVLGSRFWVQGSEVQGSEVQGSGVQGSKGRLGRVSDCECPTFNLPTFNLPTFNLPTFNMPTFEPATHDGRPNSQPVNPQLSRRDTTVEPKNQPTDTRSVATPQRLTD